MWLSAEAVRASFVRLRLNIPDGKAGTERTSALFYFLAFDSSYKSQAPLSFDPDSVLGRQNRGVFTREYCKLSILKVLGNQSFLCTDDLGFVTKNGTAPEKRVSSNFLTTPLKRASQRPTPQAYPSRPSGMPLLQLGPCLVRGNWGIGLHPNWHVDLHKYLSERLTRAPFSDLAVYVLRDDALDRRDTFEDTLSAGLFDRFSDKLANFWSQQILRESRFARIQHTANWHSDEYHHAFDSEAWVDQNRAKSEVESLKERIVYLERLLSGHSIPYQA